MSEAIEKQEMKETDKQKNKTQAVEKGGQKMKGSLQFNKTVDLEIMKTTLRVKTAHL